MAAGQILTGQPWWGVWGSVGLMCGAICWALSYAFRIQWALFGALAAALQFGIFGFWMNSYFGGAVAAIGGALVAGALIRMRDKALSSGVIGGVGLTILYASRPLEAVLWTAVAGVWLAARHRRILFRTALPALLVCGSGVAVLAYYDYKVTGDPLKPPYVEGRVEYGTPQSFWWQPPVIVGSFDNPQLKKNYLNQLDFWNRRYSVSALWDSTWRRLRDFWRFFVGPFFTPALLFLPAVWRDRRIRPWLYAAVPFLLDHATYHAWYPQQSAAETVLIAIILVQCWRHLRVWSRNRGWGLAISRNLTAGFAVALILITGGHAAEDRFPQQISGVKAIWASLAPAPHFRDQVVAKLEGMPGKHLVFVYYGPNHASSDEWVFNKANIPGTPIVFARLINSQSDLKLISAMDNYDVWLAEPDAGHLHMLFDRNREATRAISVLEPLGKTPPRFPDLAAFPSAE